jgi:hypothetical protein
MWVRVIWNNASSLKSAGRTACSAGKYTLSCSNDTVMMLSMTQRGAIGPDSSSWAGSVPKTQERLADPQFQCSASNAEWTRGFRSSFQRI